LEFANWFNGTEKDKIDWLQGNELFYKGTGKGIDDAFSYYQNFGITKNILREYNVRSIEWFKTTDNSGAIRRCYQSYLPEGLKIIAYDNINFAKLYNPLGHSSMSKFLYVGLKPHDYLFGSHEILRRMHKHNTYNDTVIITGGEKDVLTLTGLGYDAGCFNSETAQVSESMIRDFFSLFKRIVICYDVDATGIGQSRILFEKLSLRFEVKIYELPSELKERNGKDISDYIELELDPSIIRAGIDGLFNETSIVRAEIIDSHVGIGEIGKGPDPLDQGIYELLPTSLRKICARFDDLREKDLILLSAMATISTLFPNVSGYQRGKRVGANLYLFVSAPAAAGKGIMMFSKLLADKIHKQLKNEYKQLFAKYQTDLINYENNKKDNPDLAKPQEPKCKLLFIPANISTSMMVQILDANQNFGLIFETEGDTLTDALGTEWGNFSDILRKSFHHESISMSRRTNNESIEVERPHLSIVLSGTENQVNSLIESVENGFFSRMLFYTFRSTHEWKDQFDEKEENIEETFNEMAAMLLEFWSIQKTSSSVVRFSPSQKEKHHQYFAAKVPQLQRIYGDAIVSSLKRMGLIFYRITLVLTIIRKLDANRQLEPEMIVEEIDFEIAYRIIDSLIVHLTTVFERMENGSRTSKLHTQQRALYEQLPKEFDRMQYNTVAHELGIKCKTAERYIGIYIKKDLLVRFEHGKYQKM